jgi:hypothetical protein
MDVKAQAMLRNGIVAKTVLIRNVATDSRERPCHRDETVPKQLLATHGPATPDHLSLIVRTNAQPIAGSRPSIAKKSYQSSFSLLTVRQRRISFQLSSERFFLRRSYGEQVSTQATHIQCCARQPRESPLREFLPILPAKKRVRKATAPALSRTA